MSDDGVRRVDAALLSVSPTRIAMPRYNAAQGLLDRNLRPSRMAMTADKQPRWIHPINQRPRATTGKTQRFELREQASLL